MRWKKQANKGNCGQNCISMITGIGLRKIYKIIGHDQGTKTRELIKCLRKLGYKCSDKLKIFNKNIPELAICKLKYPDSHSWHWVVKYKDKIFDGHYGDNNGNLRWEEDWRISTYLPIEKD